MAWDTCRTLLRTRVPPHRDVVAVVVPNSFLARRLAEEVHADRLFLHAPNDALAASDGDWDVSHVRRPWPALASPGAQRLRRLDTLYAQSHDVGLLVIGNLADFTPLAGAQALLSAHRPAVLLDLADIPPLRRTAVARAARAALAGYVWHDAFLLQLPEMEDVTAAIAGAETSFALLPPGAAHLAAPTPVPLPAGVDPLLTALAWRGWTWPVRPQGVTRLALELDGALVCAGFHAPETDGHTVWRWSGPARASTMWLPVPSYGSWRVALDVFSWGVLDGPSGIRLSLQGGPLAAPDVEGSRIRLGPVDITPSGTSPSGTSPSGTSPSGTSTAIRVDIVCARMRPGTPDDPRTLGLCISGCTLEREN